jgi:hypothetical protein
MGLSQMVKNNRAAQIVILIVVPTVLIGVCLGVHYGYKYIKKKAEDKKSDEEIEKMREKYEKINSVDEFLEGIKYIEDKKQIGRELDAFTKKRAELEKMPIEKLKRLYVLLQIIDDIKTPKQQEELLNMLNELFPKTEEQK